MVHSLEIYLKFIFQRHRPILSCIHEFQMDHFAPHPLKFKKQTNMWQIWADAILVEAHMFNIYHFSDVAACTILQHKIWILLKYPKIYVFFHIFLYRILKSVCSFSFYLFPKGVLLILYHTNISSKNSFKILFTAKVLNLPPIHVNTIFSAGGLSISIVYQDSCNQV